MHPTKQMKAWYKRKQKYIRFLLNELRKARLERVKLGYY